MAGGAGLKHTAIAFGVVVDKMKLLRGEPTSIAEQRDDAAREARLEEFRRRYGRVCGVDGDDDAPADVGADGGR